MIASLSGVFDVPVTFTVEGRGRSVQVVEATVPVHIPVATREAAPVRFVVAGTGIPVHYRQLRDELFGCSAALGFVRGAVLAEALVPTTSMPPHFRRRKDGIDVLTEKAQLAADEHLLIDAHLWEKTLPPEYHVKGASITVEPGGCGPDGRFAHDQWDDAEWWARRHGAGEEAIRNAPRIVEKSRRSTAETTPRTWAA